MIDPAMIQWNPNPEMFPNRPVGLPYNTMPTARIAIDPINAFNQQPMPTANVAVDPIGAFNPPPAMTSTAAQTGSNWQAQMQPLNAPSMPAPTPDRTFAPSYGPMQDLALQMAGYGAPSGIRSPSQMAVTPVGVGSGGGGYDGADPNRGDDRNPAANPADNLLYNGGGVIGVGGGNSLPTNQGWINSILDNATGIMPPGATINISNPLAGANWQDALQTGGAALLTTGNPLIGAAAGLYNLFSSSQNSQTPEGDFTPQTGPTLYDEIFGFMDGSGQAEATPAPSGPQTTPYTGNVYRRPIPVTQRTRPGHLGEDSGR